MDRMGCSPDRTLRPQLPGIMAQPKASTMRTCRFFTSTLFPHSTMGMFSHTLRAWARRSETPGQPQMRAGNKV